MLLDATCAVAGRAGFLDHLAGAVALGAGLLDREKALLHTYLAVAAAGGAGDGLRAGTRAAAMTGFALGHDRNADLGLGAARGIFERYFHVVAQVGTAINIGASAATGTATKDIAENVAERIGEIAEALSPWTCTRTGIDTRVTELIVGGTLVVIGQHFVGFLGLFEAFLGFGIVRIAVGVMLHGQFAIRFLDLIFCGVAVDA